MSMMYIFSFSFADYWPPHQTAVSQDPKNKNNNKKKLKSEKPQYTLIMLN